MCYVSPVWSTGRFRAVLWVFYVNLYIERKPFTLQNWKNSRRSGPCLLEGGLRPENPSNRRFFRPKANFYDRCTAENLSKRNIPTHVDENEHFLEPSPKYLLSPDAVIRQLDTALVWDQISLDWGWLSQINWNLISRYLVRFHVRTINNNRKR